MRRWYAALFVALSLAWALPAQAQVTFDAKFGDVNFPATNTGTVTAPNSMTVGAGSNRFAVFAIVTATTLPTTAPTVTSVNWDSSGTPQAATFINGLTLATAAHSLRIEWWGLKAPTSGNKTVAVVLSAAANDFQVSGVAYTGVDQTTPTANAATGSNAASSAPSLAITSATNNAVVAAFVIDATNITAITSTSTPTTIWLDNGGSDSGSAGVRSVGAATVTSSMTPNQAWVAAGLSIQAIGGAASFVANPSILGIGP